MSTLDLTDVGIVLRHDRPGRAPRTMPQCDRGPRDDALACGSSPTAAPLALLPVRLEGRGRQRQRHGDEASLDTATTPEGQRQGRRRTRGRCGARPFRSRPGPSPRPISIAAVPRLIPTATCAGTGVSGTRSGHVGPALVARVTDAVTGKPMTLHRTWLAARRLGQGRRRPHGSTGRTAEDGRRDPALARREVTGGLAIAEGIETRLAAARAFTPIWAMLDAGNLAAFPVLDGIDALTIFADHDKPNRRPAAAPDMTRPWPAQALARCGPRGARLVRQRLEGADFADLAAGARQ